MVDGCTVWRLSARSVVNLYRTGVRFFIRRCDQPLEVYVDDLELNREPLLRTTHDRPTVYQLLLLERFADQPAVKNLRQRVASTSCWPL